MIIDAISIKDPIKEKIAIKHRVYENEIKDIIFNDKPIFKKSSGRHLCIGFKRRYITIIFDYMGINKQANIVTAYPSSKWQINLYKRMKK